MKSQNFNVNGYQFNWIKANLAAPAYSQYDKLVKQGWRSPMPSFSSHSRRLRLSTKPNQTDSVNSLFSGHHATVNCLECNRSMVPRVVTYYGQPLRSICPFCGATFAKFPGGFQQFFQRFSKKIVSFDAFKRIALVAAGFGLIWLLAKMEIIPREMEALGIFGSIIFSAFGLAELFYQTIEFIAKQFSHNSRYYWSATALIAILILYVRDDLTRYVVMASFLMIVRWILAGFAVARSHSH
ncbi:hypothetical protein NP603_17930 [Methylomonas sp. SURF-1]|uniref:Uncharacterized protein n=1 Tax=Methylomonas aurea TaxID=2952224 RepID=A0ABT1UMY8_9GAMM|nr:MULTISPECIES: hypothetical protein [unclassified Methylomonas]MCQ8183005.1 hypothetical protein [Methylomonas sp. SURF-1]